MVFALTTTVTYAIEKGIVIATVTPTLVRSVDHPSVIHVEEPTKANAKPTGDDHHNNNSNNSKLHQSSN